MSGSIRSTAFRATRTTSMCTGFATSSDTETGSLPA